MVRAKCVTYHTLPRPTAAPSSSSTLLAITVLLAIHVLVAQSAIVNVYQGGSVQDALDYVSPGDTIIINPGNYFEDIVTKPDGTESATITIKGSEDESNRGNVVLRGTGDSNYIFEVKHDYYTIENFSIDGLGDDDFDDDAKYEDAYRDKLIFVYANREPTTREGGYRSTLDGIIIRDMNLINAGAECIRLRHFVTFAEIYGNRILNCGVYDFFYDDGGKNGEGIYIGTASGQWSENYTNDPDETRGTHVHDNIIETNGSEGVDIKEGCVDTIIEENEIYMQKDEDGGGINSRADGSIIRNNYIQDTDGAGIRLGGNRVDGHQYGVDHQVYGNYLRECRSFGVKIMESPQEKICGNTIQVPDGEDPDDYDFMGGEYRDDYDARELCADAPSPVPEPTLAPPGSSGTYLGCFEDQMGARTMSSGYKDKENLTNEACIEYCSSNGNEFAGTSNKSKCRCTNNELKVYRHGLSDNCTKACPGDEDQICGGKWAVSSWRIIG